MKISWESDDFKEKKYDIILMGVFEKESSKIKSRILKSYSFNKYAETLKFNSENKQMAFVHGEKDSPHLFIIGLGDRETFNDEMMRIRFSQAISKIKKMRMSSILVIPPEKADPEHEAYELSYLAVMTDYDFNRFKSEKINGIEKVGIYSATDISENIKLARIVGDATNLTKDLGNLPSSIGTPTHFETVAKGFRGIDVKVLGREDFIKLGMGGIEAVSRSAREPARMIIMEYKGSDQPPILIVGKGITFDSGGISIKSSEGLEEMKFDKCGASAVLGSMYAISEAGLKVHVVGITPLTENLPGGNAYKPGDILTHYNGVTSEVISTDAEGRLVLADALSYGVKNYDPSAVIDLATLTGACIVALGNNIAGSMTNSIELQQKILDASKKTWEKVWPLPLDDDFKEQIKSDVADIKNTGGRPGGAETAGAFLSNFIENKPWVHLDIAGTAWTQAKTMRKSYISKGATGFGTRLLFEYLKSCEKKDHSVKK
ncbi:MAG: leucyl aminopeptidase [Thermoplasmataceae archaeon]|jgi:leucyl aminopeptidase|nr:leucyl aminopeptidase [Candidatus Thermoplasmatota archaeon]